MFEWHGITYVAGGSLPFICVGGIRLFSKVWIYTCILCCMKYFKLGDARTLVTESDHITMMDSNKTLQGTLRLKSQGKGSYIKYWHINFRNNLLFSLTQLCQYHNVHTM